MIRTRTFLYLFLAAFCTLASAGHAIDRTKYPEVKQEIRNQVALSQLKKEADTVALYVKGLCCPSCSIGVRIKIAKLDFVDQARFNNGVDLDPEHQIVTVALKSGRTYDALTLSNAIADAGYDAMHLYTIKEDALHIEQLSSED